MERYNEQHQKNSVPLAGRQIATSLMISKDYRSNILWDGVLDKRIKNWFQDRYGSRAQAMIKLDKGVVEINDDIYQVVYPLIFGSARVYPMTFIQDLTESARRQLGDDAEDTLCKKLLNNLQAYQGIGRLGRECWINIDTSVELMLREQPEWGLAKWESMQAVEKTLKKYIDIKGGAYPYNHNLKELAKIAYGLGLKEIPEALLNSATCSATARYGEISERLHPVYRFPKCPMPLKAKDIFSCIFQNMGILRSKGIT